MRHTSNIDKVEQLGRAYDEKVLKWRAEQEWHQKFQTTLENHIRMHRGMRGSLG